MIPLPPLEDIDLIYKPLREKPNLKAYVVVYGSGISDMTYRKTVMAANAKDAAKLARVPYIKTVKRAEA